ncbi:MAG: hypothetical protein PHC46_01085 [Clostridia bacterium]|nr:hypothetical protein [Clostridia bacterium]
MAIEASILKDEKVKELLNNFKTEPSIKVLSGPVKAVVKNKKSIDLEVEIVAMQLLIDIKKGNESNFSTQLDMKNFKSKFGRLVNKTIVDSSIEALEILLKISNLDESALSALITLREDFIELREDAKIKQTKKSGKSSNSAKSTVYDNPNFKEVIAQFEANESIVYLLNLVNRSYADDLQLIRANKIISALEILTTIRETGSNSLVLFGKMSLDDFRKRVRGSISLEILDMCINSASTLFERVGDVEGATPALKNTIKDLKNRLINLREKL